MRLRGGGGRRGAAAGFGGDFCPGVRHGAGGQQLCRAGGVRMKSEE